MELKYKTRYAEIQDSLKRALEGSTDVTVKAHLRFVAAQFRLLRRVFDEIAPGCQEDPIGRFRSAIPRKGK